jgi:hypothetical protein
MEEYRSPETVLLWWIAKSDVHVDLAEEKRRTRMSFKS